MILSLLIPRSLNRTLIKTSRSHIKKGAMRGLILKIVVVPTRLRLLFDAWVTRKEHAGLSSEGFALMLSFV